MSEKKELTLLQKQQVETMKKILEYKLPAEANVVSIIFKSPSVLIETFVELKEDDFHNKCWKAFFQIAYNLLISEKKRVLDEITIGLYLDNHPNLKKIYEEFGGYETVENSKKYVKVENFEGYVSDLKKWKCILSLCKYGFPVHDRLQEFIQMSAEDIYNEYQVYLNHTFVNIDNDIKSYDICDGIYDLIEDLDKGLAVGLPYYDMPMLTAETGGQCLGTITLLGGISNVGKSTIARSVTIPSIIKYDEKVVIMINEDSFQKWQREMLVWVCNNIINYNVQKHVVRDGNYTDEVKSHLYKAAQWLQEKTKNHTITVIPFTQYKTSNAIKEIRKYASMGVKYFILDTFKLDAGKVTNNSWTEMQQNMVAIKDTIKAESLNVHILITFQLEKGSSTMRYYTQNNIGIAKNIVDVASTCIMVRDMFEDEYTGSESKKEIKAYRLEGENKRTKVMVKLEKPDRFQIFFIVKNQEGAANSYQIVARHDKSRNIIQEVGITNVRPDW